MKAYLLLLLVFCLNLNGKQERCIRCVTIYKVDIDIETVINVSPYSFSSAFAGNIDTLKKSVFFYDILRHNLNKKYLSKNASSLDTRYIIKVEYNQGLEDIIYGDRFYILFENKYYQITPLLLSQIRVH
jgi:hypothetical protein